MTPIRLVRLLDGLQAWLAALREINHEKWLQERRVSYIWPRPRRTQVEARRR